MLETKNEPQVLLRYGLSRKKELLKDFKSLYDGLVIPGNILLYQYKGTPAVVYKADQPFFVDPMSYLFAHPLDDFKKRIDVDNIKFKPSFSKLVRGHGVDPDYLQTQSYKSLVEYLLHDEDRLTPFIDSCISFQWESVNETINKSKDLLPDGKEVNLRPAFVVPPYFAYNPNDGTTDLNKKIVEYCWNERKSWPGADIFPMIFIEKQHLTKSFIKEIKDAFNKLDFPGYCIWLENFDEKIAKNADITSFIDLIKTFSEKKKKQIVLLYGGFFSMLLYKYGVTAISHGIAYSEAKSMFAAVKQSGGGSLVRYYVPQLHRFLTIENSLTLLRQRNDLICDCPICKRIVQSDPENITRFLNEEELSEIHFLYNRNKEKKMIGNLSPDDVLKYLNYIEKLNEDLDKITKPGAKNGESIIKSDYIKEWAAAISKIK